MKPDLGMQQAPLFPSKIQEVFLGMGLIKEAALIKESNELHIWKTQSEDSVLACGYFGRKGCFPVGWRRNLLV